MPENTVARRFPGAWLRLALVVASISLSSSSTRADDITKYRDRPDEWFTSDEGKFVLSNILSWQNKNGGWWKAYDVTKPRPAGDAEANKGQSIFDNGATWSELRVLGRAFRVTQKPEYREAFDKGLAMTLAAQYDNGGWPQEYPPPANKYSRHVTFNDEAMVSVMRVLRDVADGKPDVAFRTPEQRENAKAGFDKGVQCILDAQIKMDGKLTVWCAQHDAKTLEPTTARSYELPSLSGGESAEIALLLMSLDNPDDRVKQAVQAAAEWYERSKLTGIREQRKPDPSLPKGYDIVVVEDPSAPPLWARFYDLETGKPFYCGRDGVKKSSLAEIDPERRSGYAWLRPWGQKVLDAYPKWAQKHHVATTAARQ
jgi:PelA/Pel-15E family pectate lyase